MTYTSSDVIGEVTEITGEAKIIRADGSEEPIILGTEIFEGDIVETEGAGAVNIGFIDDSEFAVSSDARIAIDEFVFDPASESGAQDFSVMKGVFMYTSGLIGRENPDSVEIDTPVGSIGIRGTIIGGDINPDGESQVTVIEGAIVVRNDGGEQLLSTQYDTVSLNSMNEAPSEVRTLDVRDVANNFGAVKDVSSGLFSSFDDQMKEEGPSDNLDESSVEETLEEIQEEKATEDAAAEEVVIEDVAMEAEGEKAEKQVELKTMQDEKKAEVTEKNIDRQEARDKIAEFRENNELDDAIDVKLLAKIGDIGLKFKVGGNVDENAGAGTDVGHIVTTGDLPFDVTYSLSDDAGGLFAIDATTGVVTLTGTASDFETVAQTFYDIRIKATRSDTGATKQFDLRVDLNDVNESAEISAHTTTMLNEVTGLAEDTVVSNLSFTEADTSNSAFATRFTTNDSRFEVQMNAGQLQLVALSGASFDFETDGSNILVSITQTDGANTYSDYTVPVAISDLIDETPTNITESANTVSEDAVNGTVVAALTTTDADAGDVFTYAIISGNDDGIFSLLGDEIRVGDNTNLDFENDNAYDLDIQVTDSNGHSYSKVITIGVDNVDEPAAVNFALKDIYSITDMNALLTVGDMGALIGEIKIDDPDGATFAAGDFTIIGNAGAKPLSDLFEVKDVSGDIYLALKAGHTLVYTGGFYKINDGSNTYTLGNTNNYDFNFTISGDTGVKTLSVGFGNTTTEGITLGDTTDNEFTVNNDDFKLIRGGEGYDTLKLDGVNGNGAPDIFDFRSTISNLVGDSADLKSIEEIQISYQSGDSENTLKMNIADVLDLLKTSENGELKFSSVNVSGVDSKVEFYDGGTKETLTANGFTNNGDSDSDGFYEFTHNTLGTVLIEDTIIGAAGGGHV